jgi:hypothetical protein
MTSDDSLSLILRRLDEIERKIDHELQEHRQWPGQSSKEGLKKELAPGDTAALIGPGPKDLWRR